MVSRLKDKNPKIQQLIKSKKTVIEYDFHRASILIWEANCFQKSDTLNIRIENRVEMNVQNCNLFTIL